MDGEVEPFLNKTLIVLISKVLGPEVVTQYRSISLCTVPYKVITKFIINRLKPIMPMLVTKNQTSFVKGRHITYNVVIAQKVVHSTRVRKREKGFMALKIDMEKAYEQLRWDFIKDLLEEARLPSTLVRLIMQCVSSPIMQVLWKGTLLRNLFLLKGCVKMIRCPLIFLFSKWKGWDM